MSLHKKLGLRPDDKKDDKPKVEKSALPKTEATLRLTKSELEALAIGLGEASFKGRQIELVYRLAIKLQIELEKFK